MNTTEKLIAIQIDSLETMEKAHVNYKKSPKERITPGYVQGRLETLENNYKEFKSIHQKLITTVSEEDKCKLSYFTEDLYDTFEERYYIYKGELKTVLHKFSTETRDNKTENRSNNQASISDMKLPRITIPMFSGDYTEWQSFYDLFTTLIHKNNSLNDVQRMHYLKVSLKGDAEILLRQFPITGENYIQAWTTLKKRYDNKRYIANCHFKRFFGQKAIVQESATALKQLLDTSVECLNALKNLSLPTAEWDAIVIHVIVSKLDPETHKHWEKLVNDDMAVFPTFEKLKSFLENRFRTLEMVDPVNKNHNPTNPKTFHVTAGGDSGDIQCAFCQERHHIYKCKQFANQAVDERYVFVKKNRLCFNCLIPNHVVKRCKQWKSCQLCKGRHHSLIHQSIKQTNNDQRQKNKKVYMTTEDSKLAAPVRSSREDRVRNILLPTALVDVASECGQPLVCRALIHKGSQTSFVTSRVAELLRKKTANGKVDLQISSRYTPDFTLKVNAYVINSFNDNMPAKKINCNILPQLDNIKLADPTFNTPSEIDILFGADVFGKIIDCGLKRGQGNIIAQCTLLGWILTDDINTNSANLQTTISCPSILQVKEGKARFKQKIMEEMLASRIRPLNAKAKNKGSIFYNPM
ncbi:uncharacterized protein LOC133530860 [Cydia pomonella]|uniref:uncharacterized protein LOC133530860 n=1 Tax=Cydia pomonella TaxID=82600 RepID=UPI002ADE909D|nr:uncharacterized protein LOC133530860 [Cydia pomonella]